MQDNSNPPRYQKTDATITFDIYGDKVERVNISPFAPPIVREMVEAELKKLPKSRNYKKTNFSNK